MVRVTAEELTGIDSARGPLGRGPYLRLLATHGAALQATGEALAERAAEQDAAQRLVTELRAVLHLFHESLAAQLAARAGDDFDAAPRHVRLAYCAAAAELVQTRQALLGARLDSANATAREVIREALEADDE